MECLGISWHQVSTVYSTLSYHNLNITNRFLYRAIWRLLKDLCGDLLLKALAHIHKRDQDQVEPKISSNLV